MRSAFALLLLIACASTAPAQDSIRIAFTVDEEVGEVRWLLELFQSELRALLSSETTLNFPDDKLLEGNGDWARVAANHDALLADPEVDMIVALGPLVGAELVGRRELAKPCIAPLVWDPIASDLPLTEQGTSGVHNLSYVLTVQDLPHDLTVFRQLLPAKTMAFLASPGRLNALHQNLQAFLKRIDGLQVEIRTIPLQQDAAATVASIPDDVDAVFIAEIGPPENPRLAELLHAIHARGIGTFYGGGEAGVRNGALAAMTPTSWYTRLARRCALSIHEILRGGEAGDIAVHMVRQGQLYLNMETARALKISPTFDLLSDAIVIGSTQREPERVLDLPQVMREAMERNRDLAAARRELEAAQEDVSIARASLLPQLEATLAERWIDEDRAETGNAGARQTALARLELSQLIFSERAWANHSVRKHLRRAAESSLRRQELDVILDAAGAYFDVLQAAADEEIRKENLNLTRSNLERARLRERLGAASPAEGYRWESQLAQDRDAVVSSIARRNLTELQLNRVLSLPLETKLGLVTPRTREDLLRYIDPRFLPYIDNQRGLRILRNFGALVAEENSPELAELDAAIRAQERLRDSATRRFFMPDLVLNGNVAQTLNRVGAGADLLDLAPIDDRDWELTLGLSLPVFNGGERIAQRAKANADLSRLHDERDALLERIQQRIRAAIHVASASYTRIGLTEQASAAARENFDLVSDAYGRGAVSIITLLDAQTAYFTASTQAANATFQFLSDLMEVERAAGNFVLLSTPAERDEIISRMQALVDEDGLED